MRTPPESAGARHGEGAAARNVRELAETERKGLLHERLESYQSEKHSKLSATFHCSVSDPIGLCCCCRRPDVHDRHVCRRRASTTRGSHGDTVQHRLWLRVDG